MIPTAVTGPPRRRPELLGPAAEGSNPQGADFKGLLEAYERSLILAALAATGGRQGGAARLLGILPSTLHEKIKRLGIRAHFTRRGPEPPDPEASASLLWRGSVAPGATLELRGLNGPVRIEAGADHQIEISATRRGPRELLSSVEVKIVEHARGVTVCAACPGLAGSVPRRLERRISQASGSLRVDLFARVPPGLHVVASTVNDDIEVVGLVSNVHAGTANGQVRFLPASTLLREAAE